MDWIRRNWPDLLIAIALVAVIAGIIATLLSGGSLWPSSRGGNTQPVTTGRTGVVNNGNAAINLRNPNSGANNGINSNANASPNLRLGDLPSANALTLGSNNVEVVSPAGGGSARSIGGNSNLALAAPLVNRNNNGLAAPLNSQTLGSPLGSQLASPRAGSSTSADINSVANNNGGVISTNGVTIPNNANSASTSGNQQLNTRNTFASPQGISVNPSNSAAATSNGSYKISVGAFGVAANAQNLANRLGQQGYPVGFDQQGNLNIVYVGPFASQNEADAIARQLRQAGQDTSVYAERQAGSANNSFQANSQRTNSQRTNSQQNFQQQTAASSQNTAPVGAGRSYLQVGAYNDVPSSLSQRSRLEGLGLTVYDRREGGYVKLIVGPFASNEVGVYRSQLRDRGIDSFPVN